MSYELWCSYHPTVPTSLAEKEEDFVIRICGANRFNDAAPFAHGAAAAPPRGLPGCGRRQARASQHQAVPRLDELGSVFAKCGGLGTWTRKTNCTTLMAASVFAIVIIVLGVALYLFEEFDVMRENSEFVRNRVRNSTAGITNLVQGSDDLRGIAHNVFCKDYRLCDARYHVWPDEADPRYGYSSNPNGSLTIEDDKAECAATNTCWQKLR